MIRCILLFRGQSRKAVVKFMQTLKFPLYSEPSASPFLWIFFILISLFNTYIMLGLVLAVITGTFKEASSGTASKAPSRARVHPEIDCASSLVTRYKKESTDWQTSPQKAEGNTAVQATSITEASITRLKSTEDQENGEAMLRHWAKVTILVYNVSTILVYYVLQML